MPHTTRVPVPTCWGPDRRARVRLNGHDVYLGTYGTLEARQRYDEVIALWIDNGRRWPVPQGLMMRVEQLADLYIEWARAYYVKHGRPTTTVHLIIRAMELLYRAGLGQVRAGDFTPVHLKQFQRYLAGHPQQLYARSTINEYARYVRAMFKWAVGEGQLPGYRWEDLAAVSSLRKGRSPGPGLPPPRDDGPVDPVPDQDLAATLPHCGPVIRAMIDLQLLTGMRPSEVVALRGCHLTPTIVEGVVSYRVPADVNKLDHHDIERTVYIGPKGMAILRDWLPDDPDAFVFSPAEARAAFDQARRAARVCDGAHWPSHSPEARRKRKAKLKANPSPLATEPGEHYTTNSYRKAIHRACDRAFPHPTLAALEDLTPDQAAALERWRSDHRWSPNQLRHNAATYITEHEKVEVAQLILGHTSLATTMRYVKVRDQRAVLAMLKHG